MGGGGEYVSLLIISTLLKGAGKVFEVCSTDSIFFSCVVGAYLAKAIVNTSCFSCSAGLS